MKEMLENVLEKIEEALGEYAPVTETFCPEWTLPLKEAEGKVIEAIEKLDLDVGTARLEKLWQEFLAWDNGVNDTNDDETERYAKYKGATGYQAIAFMAFVEGRSIAKRESLPVVS
jgi:hypothetical protein